MELPYSCYEWSMSGACEEYVELSKVVAVGGARWEQVVGRKRLAVQCTVVCR